MDSYNPFSLKGKTILVTGAAGGIGRATSLECSKLGAKLILTDINEEGLKETLAVLENQEQHSYYIANLTTDDDIDYLVSQVDKLDGFVSNAGITKPMPVKFINREDMGRILSVNTLAPVFLTQRLLKKKKFSKGASVVFTVSIGGVYTTAYGNAMYGASKGALQVFMKNVALEAAANGIRCNSVNPGMINTGLLKPGTYSEEDRQKDMQTYPMKRYGEPREVALGIVYLLSDAASFVTGHALIIDGGKTLY
jgi:NAD(P)-dependent dehydrogenase (short-subunit alcohol dehydrogenase family)